MLKRVITLKNGTKIYQSDDDIPKPLRTTFYLNPLTCPNDEFDLIEWDKIWEMAKKVLMPKLNLKENSIIILETPSQKDGFFYDMWIKSIDSESM